MSNDFIPAPDPQFDAWANGFVDTIKVDPAVYQLSAEEVTALENKVASWNAKFSELLQKRDAAKAAVVGKDDDRNSFENLLRVISKKIQADPQVSDEAKADAGLPIHSKSKSPKPVPSTAPAATIGACNIQEHRLRFTDSTSPTSNLRPRGVVGVEVYVFVGDEAPVSDDLYKMEQISTRMRTTVDFTGEQAGKTAWYRFRYVNTCGQVGPWSTVYSSTIMK